MVSLLSSHTVSFNEKILNLVKVWGMNKAGMRISFMTVWEATTQLFAAPRGIFPVTFALTALLHSHVYSKSDFDLQLCENGWLISCCCYYAKHKCFVKVKRVWASQGVWWWAESIDARNGSLLYINGCLTCRCQLCSEQHKMSGHLWYRECLTPESVDYRPLLTTTLVLRCIFHNHHDLSFTTFWLFLKTRPTLSTLQIVTCQNMRLGGLYTGVAFIWNY